MELNSKTFFTTKNLFNEIVNRVKALDVWKYAAVDYAQATNAIDIWTCAFEPNFILHPGSNEGYYLDLEVYGRIKKDGEDGRITLGTIKTLNEDDDCIRKMAMVYAECLIAYREVINLNSDAMTRYGFNLTPYKDGTALPWRYTEVRSEEKAMQLLKSSQYNNALLRDNLTGKEKMIHC